MDDNSREEDIVAIVLTTSPSVDAEVEATEDQKPATDVEKRAISSMTAQTSCAHRITGLDISHRRRRISKDHRRILITRRRSIIRW